MPKNWTSESRVGWVPVLYSCAEWVVLKSLEVTLWQPFFGACVEVGSGNLSMRSIQQSLSMGVGCVEMYAYVKRNLGILRMECCASSSSQKVPAGQGPGLCRCTVLCGQVQTSSGEHSAQLLWQNLPTWKHFLLIYSSAVAETIVAIPLLLFSELEESLLVLPFSYVPDLLRLFNEYIQLGAEIELLCRALLFLLK